MWDGPDAVHECLPMRGNVMTGRPVRSTRAPDVVPSSAPAAVPEQRRRNALHLYLLQQRAGRQRMSRDRRRLTYALLAVVVGIVTAWGALSLTDSRTVEEPSSEVTDIDHTTTARA